MAETTPATPVTTPGTLDQKGFFVTHLLRPYRPGPADPCTRPVSHACGYAWRMAVATQRMSAADYLATPESRPRHTELIDGTVVVHEPKLPHARAQTKLIYLLYAWIDAGAGRGYVSVPADIVVDDRNVFAPDVWWVGEHRRPTADQLDLGGRARPGGRDPLAVHLGPRPGRQASRLRGGGRGRGLVRRHRGPVGAGVPALPVRFSPTFDVVGRGGSRRRAHVAAAGGIRPPGGVDLRAR